MAGIYIHFPFCKKKCNYCNFFSVASSKFRELFIDALLKEIVLQKDYLENETIQTIYFGGGTPSLLNKNELNRIFDQLNKYFRIDNNAEITLETNPDNLTKPYVNDIKHFPVNRISIGIQSFFDEELKYLGRIHNAEQSFNSLKYLQNEGFENLSIDLIYGIPNEKNNNLAIWKKNLDIAFSLHIPHISAYSLTVEPHTILESLINTGKSKPVDEQISAEHFEKLIKSMREHNFIHYEISNFCKEGFYSKHNSAYWLQKKYLGLGPSAHSYNKISRQWNIASISKYIDSLAKEIVPFEKEILSATKKYNEYILTSLRTIWGCDIDYIKSNFGETFNNLLLKESKQYFQNNFLTLSEKKILLTDRGKLFADKISSDLFMDE